MTRATWRNGWVLVLAFGGVYGGTAGVAMAQSGGAIERSSLRERAISELLALASSSEAQVRANALEGLLPASSRLEAILPAALADENEGVRAVATMVVGRARIASLADACQPLLTDPSTFVRAGAIFALRRCGHDVDPTPLGAMVTEGRTAQIRAHAAYILGELGDKGTLGLLRDAASRDVPRASVVENRVLQVQIAEAMCKLGDAEQLHTIRAAMFPATADEFDAAVLAVQTLGVLDDRASTGQLRNLAMQQDSAGAMQPIEMRLAIAGALGRLGSGELESVAIETSRAEDWRVRVQSAWALGEIGTGTALRRLEEMLAEPEEFVRVSAAAGVLRALGARDSRIGQGNSLD